jgi:hypothetical protein
LPGITILSAACADKYEAQEQAKDWSAKILAHWLSNSLIPTENKGQSSQIISNKTRIAAVHT